MADTLNSEALLGAIGEVKAQLMNQMSLLNPTDVNRVPYKDSWTAGQLFRHVSKAAAGIASAVKADGKPAGRDPGEKIPELRDVFLNYSTKLKSPEEIVPEERKYDREDSLKELDHSFTALQENAARTDLTEMIDKTPLGPRTKWEMLHLVLYHSQRHLHQLKKITDALQA